MGEAATQPRAYSTLRQERLAAALLDPNVKTHTEAMIKAGYSPATARSSPGRQRNLAGTQTALQVIEDRKVDKARGLDAIIARTIERPELVEQLDARDQLQLGMAALKLRHDIGDVPDSGDAGVFLAWRRALVRRIAGRVLRMATTGKGPLGWSRPLDVVVSTESESVITE